MDTDNPIRDFENRVPPNDAKAVIDDAISKISGSPEINDWFKSYAKNHRNRLAFDFQTVSTQLNKSDLIVECGSAPFILTQSLNENGYNIVGLDIAPARFQKTIELNRLNVKECDIETARLPFEDNSAGCVLFNQLFEHLRINPIKTMRETLRILKPGGQLHLSTPNLLSVSGLIKLFRHKTAFSCENGVYEQYDKLEKLGHMGHVREYTAHEVAEFLKKTGFHVKRVTFRGTYKSYWKRALLNVAPSYRPHFGIVAIKS